MKSMIIRLIFGCLIYLGLNSCTQSPPSDIPTKTEVFSSNNQGLVYQGADLLAGDQIFHTCSDPSSIQTMVIDQNDDIYIGTEVGNIYKILKGTSVCTQLGGGSSPATYRKAINSITVDTNGNVYAVSNWRVFKISKGSSWEYLGGGNDGYYFSSVAIDGSDKIYAAGRSSGCVGWGACVYQINGNSFTQLGGVTSSPDDSMVNSIAIDSRGKVYAGTLGPRSINGSVYEVNSESWVQLGGGANPDPLQQQRAIGPQITLVRVDVSNNIHAITSIGSVYKIDQETSSWNKLGGGSSSPDGTFVISAVIDSSGNAYVATQAGNIFKMSQGASDWVQIGDISGLGGGYVNSIAVDSSGNIYASTYNGIIYKIMKSANTWIPVIGVSGSIDGSRINSMSLDTKGNAYVGTRKGNVYERTRGASSWTQLGGGKSSPSFAVNSIAVSSNGNVYVGTSGEFYINEEFHVNGGIYEITKESWIQLGGGSNPDSGYNRWSQVQSIQVDIMGNIYASTGVGNIYEIPQGASSWTQLGGGSSPDGTYASSIAIDISGNVYAGTFGGSVFKISKGASSWTLLGGKSSPDGSPVHSIAIDSSGNVYAGTVGPRGINGSVYEVTARSWRQLGGGSNPDKPNLVGFGPLVQTVQVDNSGNVYVGTGRGNVYEIRKGANEYINLHYGNGASVTSIAIESTH